MQSALRHGSFSQECGFSKRSNIIQKDLIFDVDFTNPKCWNGQSVAYDLVRKMRLKPLGTTTYTRDNGGSLQTSSAGSITTDNYLTTNQANTSTGIIPDDKLTLSVWIRTATRRFATERYFRVASEGMAIRHNGAASLGQLDCYVYLNNYANFLRLQINTQIANNAIYHLVCTWDGNNLLVYNNAVLVGSTSRSGKNYLTINGYNSYEMGFNGTEYFNGQIFRASAYSNALTQLEVTQNHNMFVNRFL